MRGSRGVGLRDSRARVELLRVWWPLALLVVLAAGLRLGTLNLQSFWYDEAFTPVHVLHAGLGATLRAFVHTENTPPLWYVGGLGLGARVRDRGGRAAAALGARGNRDGAGRVGDRLRAGRRGDAAIVTGGARGLQPAAGLVLPGGARVRVLRAVRGAGDALRAARRPGADAAPAGAVRAERGAGAAEPLLRGLPADPDGAVAAAAAACERWRDQTSIRWSGGWRCGGCRHG